MADEQTVEGGTSTEGQETEGGTSVEDKENQGAAGTEGNGTDEGTEQNTDKSGKDESNEDSSKEGDEAGKSANDVPENYDDFTMPEGIEVDETALKEAAPVFKELGLNQEQAQKLVDLQAKMAVEGQKAQVEAFNAQLDDWDTQSLNDKEFGGDKFDENIKTASLAVEKFGTPELKTMLETHGLYAHPEVVRFFYRVGNTLKEDNPGSGGNPVKGKTDRVTQLYGPQNKE